MLDKFRLEDLPSNRANNRRVTERLRRVREEEFLREKWEAEKQRPWPPTVCTTDGYYVDTFASCGCACQWSSRG